MWSLTDVDKVPLTCLPVLGEASWYSETNCHMSVSLPIVGSYAASAFKFINKIGLQSFRNTIFKSAIIFTCLKCKS